MSDPRPSEFEQFHELLTENAPDGYRPWYFRVRSGSKAPATKYGSWKEEEARLSYEEALGWLKDGGNVGIAGTADDELVNVDIDDEDETTPDDLKETLIARSRSRTGVHAWYFETEDTEIPNIPTDKAGEVRANWQYVVAPGSYVETDPEEVPDGYGDDAGYYTVERPNRVTSLRFEELPQVFKQQYQQTEQEDNDAEVEYEPPERNADSDERRSALFDIEASDVVRKEGGDTDTDERWSSLFHGSDTDANMSMSSRGLIQCWRHNVTHNGLQALVTLSDYSRGCEAVGSGHRSSNAGDSCIKQENGAAVWAAWKYAKRNGYIPEDDPVPYNAIKHVCSQRDICTVAELPDSSGDETLPEHAYNGAIESIENYDELNSGRKRTDEIDDNSTTERPDPPEPNTDDDSPELTWQDVRDAYQFAEQEQNATKGTARKAAADVLEKKTSWMYVLESEQLWVYDDDSGQYRKFGASTATHRLESELGAFYAESERREVIGRLEARNQVHRDVLNARNRDDPLLCVKNGVINLRTGERTDHGPEYHFVRGLDVAYDPTDSDPEKVVDFLDEVTQREADRDTLLDHLAHGLMPGHPYRAFVVCYGPGGNGKTQVSELFRGFVGSENAAAVEIDELAAGDFATGDLPGTFINWGDDMAGDGGGQLSDLSLLKKATGGSEIRANEKYEKTFNFKNEAAMFFSANEPPRIGEKKPSIQDRIYPIEMPYRFKSDPDEDDPMQKKKVPNVSKGLLADDAAMRGLLTLAVDHAKELKANEGQYSQPESPEERLEKYNRSADPIVKFAGRALREADADSKIRKDDAHRVFREFTESWEERSASERGFKRQLPGATSFEMESARSRALANPDDGEDRVMCWKRVQWSETARKQMPDWMADRYADHFDNADTTETADEKAGDSGSNPTLKQLDPGRHTVEATVAEQLEPKPWLQGEGTLVDDGELLDYQARGDSNPLSSVSEGDRVQIKNAKVTTDQDGLKLLEVTGVCEVQVLDSSDPDQTSVEDAATGEQAATDGGESGESKPQTDAEVNQSLIKNATETVNAEYDSGDEITAPSFAGRNGLSPKQGEAVLEHLTTEKGLLERLDDGYRVLL